MFRYAYATLFSLGICVANVLYPSIVHASAPQVSGELFTPQGSTTILLHEIPSVGDVALGDLGTDGILEIAASTGYGDPTKIYVFRQDGSVIGSFFPFDPAFTGGANISLCDLDGDTHNEILVAAGFSGGAHIRAFDRFGEPFPVDFFAYDAHLRGGVHVACLDGDGNGQPEIYTLPGPLDGGQLKVFSHTGKLLHEYTLLENYLGTPLVLNEEFASHTIRVDAPLHATLSPLSISLDESLTVREISSSPTSFPTISDNNTYTFSATASHDTSPIRFSTYTRTPYISDPSASYILVDISRQSLTAYSHHIPLHTFIVSTGVASYPTPQGRTTVTAKLPVHDYSWYFGSGDSRNYSLPDVLWNLRFRDRYYLHSAYWHNNFGTPMSHGCVNMKIPDAEILYHWADVGTVVEIVE